jgi:uncharacterized phiE125 gp8 family phage protein
MFWDPVRIEPPAALPVTLAELKAQTRYFQSDEDAIMQAMLRSSVEVLENYTYLGFITQTWQQSFSAFPATLATPRLKLQRRPVQEVLSISYLDSADFEQLVDPLTYQVAGIGNSHACATVRISSAQTWPTVYDSSDAAVTITYRVGFGDDHNAVPEQIRDAILLCAGTKFAYREDVVMGTSLSEIPEKSKVLLRDWRPLAVA